MGPSRTSPAALFRPMAPSAGGLWSTVLCACPAPCSAQAAAQMLARAPPSPGQLPTGRERGLLPRLDRRGEGLERDSTEPKGPVDGLIYTKSLPPMILCDSCYAMDMLDGRAVPKKNLSLIQRGRELLRRVRQQRTVTFVHVKGHS